MDHPQKSGSVKLSLYRTLQPESKPTTAESFHARRNGFHTVPIHAPSLENEIIESSSSLSASFIWSRPIHTNNTGHGESIWKNITIFLLVAVENLNRRNLTAQTWPLFLHYLVSLKFTFIQQEKRWNYTCPSTLSSQLFRTLHDIQKLHGAWAISLHFGHRFVFVDTESLDSRLRYPTRWNNTSRALPFRELQVFNYERRGYVFNTSLLDTSLTAASFVVPFRKLSVHYSKSKSASAGSTKTALLKIKNRLQVPSRSTQKVLSPTTQSRPPKAVVIPDTSSKPLPQDRCSRLLKLYSLDIFCRKHYWITLVIHVPIPLGPVAALFIRFCMLLRPMIFCSPYHFIDVLMVLSSSMFLSCGEHSLFSGFFVDLFISFTITACSYTWACKFLLDTL